MRRFAVLTFILAVSLAGPVKGSVRKGATVLDLMGGWGMETAEDTNKDTEFVSGATGEDYTGWLAMGGLGHFTSDNLEIAVAGFGAWIGSDGITATVPLVEGYPGFSDVYDVDVDATVYGVGGRLLWYMTPASKRGLYVGVQGFWATADVDISGTATLIDDTSTPVLQATVSEQDSVNGILWGPVVGLRCELGARDDLLVEYQYHQWIGDLSDALQGGHALFIGISHQVN